MANNYVHDGRTIYAVNATGSDVVSGEAFKAGDTMAVALVDIANTEAGMCARAGCFSLPAAAETIAAGSKVNFAGGVVTALAGEPLGVLASALTSGDATAEVILVSDNDNGAT